MIQREVVQALHMPAAKADSPTRAGAMPPDHGRALKNWLDSLPLANCAAAADVLSEALAAQANARLNSDRRLHLLEALRAPVQQVCSTLEKRYLGQPIPLLQRPAHANAQVHDLLTGMMMGYRQVILDLLDQGTPRFGRKRRLALACVRSLTYLGDILLRTYQVYAADPPGLWRQIYATWSASYLHELQEVQVDDEHCRYRQKRSCDDVFKQVLLLALCNPYRLGQREIAEVNSAFEVWGEECHLRSGSAAPGPGLFSFDVYVDRVPSILRADLARDSQANGESDGDSGPQEAWILDAHRVAERLQYSDATQAGKDAVTLEQSSRDRIMMAWGIVAPRGFRRLPARHRLEAIVGLRGVHFAVAGMRDFDSLARGEIDPSGQLAHWARASAEQRTRTTSSCRVVDQSFGGYRLRWEAEENVRLRVGELLATSRPAEGAEARNWITGVVRWIRSDVEGNLEAGVELLARTCEAVVVFPDPKRRDPAKAIRGLLLEPLNRGEPEMPMVITDSSLKDAERMVLADRRTSTNLAPDEDAQLTLRLVRRVEHTPAFAQFHYQIRNLRNTPTATPAIPD